MPDFQYKARAATGGQVSGVLSASSEQEALQLLASQSLFPVQIAVSEGHQKQVAASTRRVPARHLAVFYTQLADLIRAGVPLLRSLELLQNKLGHPGLRYVVRDVRERVQDGTRLAEALRYHPRVFSDLAVSMVRAGEEGAFLEDVLKRIATFTEHQENLKSRILGAMIYPIFLLVMGTGIVVVMLTFFVPKFTPIFAKMARKGTLPWATTTLLSISDMIRDYGWIGLLLGVLAGIFLYRRLNDDAGRLRLDRLRLKAPGAGPIFRSLALARFCRILGTLLRNGVPILQSLNIARDATGNRVLSEAIGNAAASVSTGKSLAAPLSASGQFPDEIVEMISVGEEANNLDQVLIDVADNLETTTNRHLEMFVRMLEPVLLTVMAAIVLFVVIALLLPIMNSSMAM